MTQIERTSPACTLPTPRVAAVLQIGTIPTIEYAQSLLAGLIRMMPRDSACGPLVSLLEKAAAEADDLLEVSR